MLEQLIVIDYQEGAGGEYVANWLSAHFGQKLESDLQLNPNYLQKWLNSHSLIQADWRENFNKYLLTFNNECARHGIRSIAVPYHLYKYPEHTETLARVNHARFVRVNCTGYELQVASDFQRKVLNRVLGSTDFAEVKFILKHQSQEKIQHCLDLYKHRKLTYRDLLPCNLKIELKSLPSNDIEIMYEDFFVAFDQTPAAYQNLCKQLQLTPNAQLLDALIDRNKKNLQHSQII
jgi:hypothetical protein